MPGLRLYCDEDSLDKAVIAALRRQRWDVLTVTEAGMAGRSDDEHLVFALGVNCVVYTANVGDFARLHAEYAASSQVHAGVIGRTRQRMPIGEQARALLAIGAAFDAEAMAGRFVYLEEFVA